MSTRYTKIHNGKIITPQGIQEGSILVDGETILDISDRNIEVADALEIDAEGGYISPGFIDIHVHGGGGHDFMDNTVEAYLAIAETHARFGTTAMWPTTLTSDRQGIIQSVLTYDAAKDKNTNGSQFLGLHLEGPYFAMNQRGAQDPRYIRDPDPEEYKEILSHTRSIKRWSAAPELKGAIEFGRFLKSQGILPAIAHTNAVYEEALAAFKEGYTLATHFYSAMSGVTRRNAYRYAGVVEAGYLIDEMDVEIIADGVHLPAPLLQLIMKIKGPEKTALITDAMRAAAMPEGESVLGNKENGLKVIVEDGVAKLPDRTAFAGSVATADRLVRTMIRTAGVPLHTAVQMISATPARIAGVTDKKGVLGKGMDADIVIFDEDIRVNLTMIRGRVVFQQ
ncbi:MAG: N-acetylglucosamine-6-phosphate deacetylase [Chitinophagaceae bacterium]|nr:N-acetylglucosamine-6-phosphate deacetylase [Chitinophagaceae bacterium]MCW5928497.1 N-acetylglucosamine-6-phosphate deacetylase [Chitinophagaceae bacterium]